MAGRRLKPLNSAGYGPAELAGDLAVSRETLARFETFAALIRKWQPTVNLVGNDTLDDLWRRHFLDSGQLYPHLPTAYDALYDLGSGAGFPGIVLALLGAGHVCLIESDQRKAAFLREVIRATDAAATVWVGRIESFTLPARDPPPRIVLTARAVAPLAALLALARPLITPDTICLFNKGARATDEITEARRHWSMRLETIPSLSDARGVILRINELAHV